MTCSEGKSLSMQPRGVFLIKSGIPCNGSLVSWHVCFFTGASEPFLLLAAVYRPINDTYVRFSAVERFNIELSATDRYGCMNENEEIPVAVEAGDVIAVGVLADGFQRRFPVFPFLDSAPNISLLHLPNNGLMMETISSGELQPTQLGLNLKASIVGELQTPVATPTSIHGKNLAQLEASTQSRCLCTISLDFCMFC